MRAPLKWLSEQVALPPMTGRELAEALIRAGLEVETVEQLGGEISGPLVVGKVLEFVDEPQKNGKTIRWCQVDVGAANGGVRGIVCGALNFAVNDHVVVSLPGVTLPGGFTISARKTYGHVSDGMICSELELELGHDHDGIMILGDTDDFGQPWVLGSSALTALGLDDEVLDIAVTPDMGYCFSIRGLAREAGQALGVRFTDPVSLVTPAAKSDGYPVSVRDEACPLFVAVTVTGIDPHRPTPRWMAARLAAAGMRSISLAVDISNYVMLETGQPNHAYDRAALSGSIVVRRALPGEKLVTLDDTERTLDPEDLVIADDSGAIGLAGLMGGATTELSSDTRDVVIEAASFDQITVARMSRRHKLSSEASRRFERGVDPNAAYSAAHRVAQLLVELAGGTLIAAETVVGGLTPVPSCVLDAGLVSQVLGLDVPVEQSVSILRASGVSVSVTGSELTLTAPTWRPDLREPFEFVEEVGRKIGFDEIGVIVPTPPAGRGFTRSQQARRQILAALTQAGFVEVLTFPFAASEDLDKLGVPDDDERRATVALANPLSDAAPLLRTTILPGLIGAVQRNASRSIDDVALVEVGSVFFAGNGKPAPEPAVDDRPSESEMVALELSLPRQPKHLAAIITGAWQAPTWDRPAVPGGWVQAFAAADLAAGALGAKVTRVAAQRDPWHPRRCAELWVGDTWIGYAGELHPKVCQAFSLAPRTAALEINLNALIAAAPDGGSIARVSSRPAVKEAIALVVDEAVTVGDLQAAVVAGGGDLLESVSLFDIYRGKPLADGQKSVAFALRYRAADRTLTDVEAAAVRDAAVANCVTLFGAELRTY